MYCQFFSLYIFILSFSLLCMCFVCLHIYNEDCSYHLHLGCGVSNFISDGSRFRGIGVRIKSCSLCISIHLKRIFFKNGCCQGDEILRKWASSWAGFISESVGSNKRTATPQLPPGHETEQRKGHPDIFEVTSLLRECF